MNDYSHHCRKRNETLSRAGTHITESDLMWQSPRVPIIDHSNKNNMSNFTPRAVTDLGVSFQLPGAYTCTYNLTLQV